MKVFLPIISMLAMAGCSSTPNVDFNEYYGSTWTNKASETTYTNCSVVWLNKDMMSSHNLQRLVENGKLTTEQAARAAKSFPKVGDPECMAYASYGLHRNTITLTRDKNKQLIRKGTTYLCENSNAPCTGIKVEIENGLISSVEPLAK